MSPESLNIFVILVSISKKERKKHLTDVTSMKTKAYYSSILTAV